MRSKEITDSPERKSTMKSLIASKSGISARSSYRSITIKTPDPRERGGSVDVSEAV